ncbi:receptor-like protein kinase ANXUR2 [Prosopis cineraria]|uniref:receptor-like protein kinase ANXUR2 n=1 Tax=Prosopis cineraria TaxID=364024 RepID=UPI0024103833|nr:receptor-like protein kinase ANXUR2 [Prosopis cineraria]
MAILLKCCGGSGSYATKQPRTPIEDLCHRFSLTQLGKSTDDFDKTRKIGEGPYGEAYRGFISINGEPKDIAVKRLRLQTPNSSYGLTLYKNEILFMCQLRHPNLVSLVGFCDDKNEMMVVYEYMPNGSLRDQLYGMKSKSPILPWKKRLEISIGVARGLHYPHSGTKRTIIHRNITPVTILLDENWIPKLSYFGLSLKGPKFSATDAKPIEIDAVQGTVGYIAPECWALANVTYKCDVYSFGVILLELICGKTSFQICEYEGHLYASDVPLFTNGVVKKVRNSGENGKNEEGIIDPRLEGEIAPQCWRLYMDIIDSCLGADPNERPDMGDVEVQLERLLQLQEEEAHANHGFHSFLF